MSGTAGDGRGGVRDRGGAAAVGCRPGRGAPGAGCEPGWAYEERVERRCPVCEGELHALRRPYESARGRCAAVVRADLSWLPHRVQPGHLGVKTYDQLTATSSAAVSVPLGPCPRMIRVDVTAIRGPRQFPGAMRGDALGVAGRPGRAGAGRAAGPVVVQGDPMDWRPTEGAVAAAEDVRVILPRGSGIRRAADLAREAPSRTGLATLGRGRRDRHGQ